MRESFKKAKVNEGSMAFTAHPKTALQQFVVEIILANFHYFFMEIDVLLA